MTAAVEATPALTPDEWKLLLTVFRWARQHLPMPRSYLPRWERELCMPPGCWKRNTLPDAPETAAVYYGTANGGDLTVKVRASRYGEELLDVTVTPRSVREAVDLLVAWDILPAVFSSAFTAGAQTAFHFAPPPQPVLSRGWAPNGGADRPLPRLLGSTPLADPALQQGDQ